MEVGFARVDITPPVGISLCGYGYYLDRNAESVHDPLYVSAVVFKRGKRGAILINYDLIGMKVETADGIRERLGKEFSIDKASIMIAATHTHSGPNTGLSRCIGEPCGSEYMKKVVEGALAAARRAWAGACEVISMKDFIDPSFQGIGFNRVLRDAGPLDSSLRGVVFYREGQRPLLLINYSCHPVVLGRNKEIAADYPGAVVAAMDEAGYDSVFLNGFCGDIDPMCNKVKWGSGNFDTIREYARTIASAAISGVSRGSDRDPRFADIMGASIKVPVPLEVFEKEYLMNVLDEARRGVATAGSRSVFRAREEWALLLLEHLESGKLKKEEEIEVAAIKIGDIFIVGIPGEVFTQVGLTVRGAYLSRNIFTVGNANGSTGYIPTRDDIERKGYGGYTSSWVYDRQPFLPGVAERLADEAVELLKGLGGGEG